MVSVAWADPALKELLGAFPSGDQGGWLESRPCSVSSLLLALPATSLYCPPELKFRDAHRLPRTPRRAVGPRRRPDPAWLRAVSLCCSRLWPGVWPAGRPWRHREGRAGPGQSYWLPRAAARMMFRVGLVEECWHQAGRSLFPPSGMSEKTPAAAVCPVPALVCGCPGAPGRWHQEA